MGAENVIGQGNSPRTLSSSQRKKGKADPWGRGIKKKVSWPIISKETMRYAREKAISQGVLVRPGRLKGHNENIVFTTG